MKWNSQTPRPSNHRGNGVYSTRTLADAEVQLASTVLFGLGVKTLIVF